MWYGSAPALSSRSTTPDATLAHRTPISETHPLILGSGSPRRRSILSDLGVPIRVHVPSVNEDELVGEGVEAYLERVVADKLSAVAQTLSAEPFAAVLVADTTVVLGERIVGKPTDVNDARRLLSDLCGNTHVVFTRYAIALAETPGHAAVSRSVRSEVKMRSAEPGELDAYANTGEGLDKAGAYAVQGIGAFLVESIHGSYTNVVGLPACEVVLDLKRLGLLPEFPLAPAKSG